MTETLMRRLLVATGNRGKLAELRADLDDLPLEVIGLEALSSSIEPPRETGTTFLENAREKALSYATAAGLWALADDSGLEVMALGGEPGVRSARFAGEHATDAQNCQRLLDALWGQTGGAREARFVCALALAAPGQLLAECEGTCSGRIAEGPRGAGGFGYDPVFFVPELGQTFAELTPDMKALYSHRGRALKAMRNKIAEILNLALS